MKIKKGDKVKVLAGKDKGKTGKVLQVVIKADKDNKVVVEGVNLHYKNTRPRREGEKGQKIQFPAAINASNVALIDPKTNKPTRVGYKISDDKKKTRIAKKSNSVI